MATPSLLQIDDRNPLVFYSPNSSWSRGGAPSDFNGTSTHTATAGASATLTFTGAGISVWGTIQFLAPNTSTYVVSSYRINNGPTTIFNATEKAGFQFQQKLFQSAELSDSVPHTIVVTLVNNATFFIDYFLVVPAGATTSSNPTPTTTDAGAQSHASRVSVVGPAVGGALGGLALLIIAVLAILLCRKRRKDKNQKHHSQAARVSPEPFITPATRSLPMQQHEGSDRVSEHLSYSQHPPTSSSGVIPPSSKTAQLSNPSPGGNSLHPRPLADSLEPPSYDE